MWGIGEKEFVLDLHNEYWQPWKSKQTIFEIVKCDMNCQENFPFAKEINKRGDGTERIYITNSKKSIWS